uniref:C2H2-type domain-containing protein n=1 Tax=Dendroctonus ponderosae TaxID=77166 RepID=A0AAR5P1U5_DENPD
MNAKQTPVTPRPSLLPKVEYKHKCIKCESTFKNMILLQKHTCNETESSLNCPVCLKQFNDIALLNTHKKCHAKSNLLKNASPIKMSSKKTIQKSSTTNNKTPMKLIDKTVKCRECSRAFESDEKLSNHVRSHKSLVCPSCATSFSSKILLDKHRTMNCVKVKNAKARISFSVRRPTVHTPSGKSPSSTILNCEKCEEKFTTFCSLYTHKVQVHGMDTPDKSLLTETKKSNLKTKPVHGGIPPNERLRKAYDNLRKKLIEAGDIVVK